MAPITLVLAALTYVSDFYGIPLALYYIVAYRQLFGYNWWGTIWRTLICLADIYMIFVACYFIEYTIRYFLGEYHLNILGALELFTPLLIITIACYYISKRTAKQRMAKSE